MAQQGIVVSHFLLLPELDGVGGSYLGKCSNEVAAVKRRSRMGEYCPRCATVSTTVYDTRTERLKDHLRSVTTRRAYVSKMESGRSRRRRNAVSPMIAMCCRCSLWLTYRLRSTTKGEERERAKGVW
jgi:hypothetical protein